MGGGAEGELLGRGGKRGVREFCFPGSSFQEVSVFQDSEDTGSAVSPQLLGGFCPNLNRPCRLRVGVCG